MVSKFSVFVGIVLPKKIIKERLCVCVCVCVFWGRGGRGTLLRGPRVNTKLPCSYILAVV